MKVLVSLYVWVVGGLYFLIFAFMAIFLSLFSKPDRFDPLLKFCLKVLLKLIFVKVCVEGREYLSKDKTYLYMSNHQSLFDVPVLEAYIPTFVRGVEAMRQFNWPIYGWLIRRMGNIPIDRNNVHASIRSIKKAAEVIKGGKSIVILPEGTRTLDGKMGSFKKLPFLLAKEGGVPIVPIGLSGLFELKSKDTWIIRPKPISIRFGRPISPEIIDSLSVKELSDLVRSEISALLD